jgi:S1-C subfamily serine protease
MTTMEDLTKTQIVLLTLLVSFITSIATGIITTSLLAQAPQAVTQTIDRVVERTIERVAPVTDGSTTVKEVTIVKEGDAMVSSIESASKSLVRVRLPDGRGLYALGVVINRQGLILTDKREIVPNGAYTVVLPDGTSVPAFVERLSPTSGLALFKISADEAKLRSLVPISFSKVDSKLGQTVVSLGGIEKNVVSEGRTTFVDEINGFLRTTVSKESEIEGGILLNLSGEVLGMKSSNSDFSLTTGAYTTVSALTKFINTP